MDTLLKLAHSHSTIKGLIVTSWLLGLFLFSACSSASDHRLVDKLNSESYAFHYRCVDSTEYYANKALSLASHYHAGRAEALNNLAFVSTIRMDYARAYQLLEEVAHVTDSQVELLVADVQLMRLCQRESRNKEFYEYREQALRRMRRIDESASDLPERASGRLRYAKSEFSIVTSTYYYYVGLEKPSVDAIHEINPDEVEKDSAQYIAYLYNVGAGGIITEGSQEEINQREFDYLLRCYLLSRQHGYLYWEANSMQAVSEHLLDEGSRRKLIADNLPAMKFLNEDMMPDSLLAGYLAQKSLDLFQQYGDVYQIAGAYRTLASCYMGIQDYQSALICLNRSLENNLIFQAPDLIASIREQLSVAYAAIDDKANSDYNRNIYLDLQEQTRQDRQLEARAELLERSSRQLNTMIIIVLVVIVVVAVMLFIFDYLRRKKESKENIGVLLEPLNKWKSENNKQLSQLNDRYEEVHEAFSLQLLHVSNAKKRHLENRAKLFIVNSIMPLIDRMLHEIKCLKERQDEHQEKRIERFGYISELCDNINEYNSFLTQWIQLRQGELSLHIESFPLQQLFDTLAKNQMSFRLKGIQLNVAPTDAIVKADRILTLFMLNTIADNARKFTPSGGHVNVWATQTTDYVEINVSDDGKGMTDQELSGLFRHHVFFDNQSDDIHDAETQPSHGYGLMNCQGIIEKYKKTSRLFEVALLSVESKVGEGSRFFFRLPSGLRKAALALLLMFIPFVSTVGSTVDELCDEAADYADSVYFDNIDAHYDRSFIHAQHIITLLNQAYRQLYPDSNDTLQWQGAISAVPPEVRWFQQRLPFDYQVIIDFRNECAVAALALHEWDLYKYNNKVYTQLFRETSADASLGDYVHTMQRSDTNKQVAVSLLILLLVVLLVAYYMLYYRHRLAYRFCVERVGQINRILLSDVDASIKHKEIATLANRPYPSQLQEVVSQIMHTLQQYSDDSREWNSNIEMAEDELRRIQFEYDKLHVCNSVLDNCLSTLKHETMYYPSRIRALIDGHEKSLQAIDELARYYKELYALLSAQAIRQVDDYRFNLKHVEASAVLPAGVYEGTSSCYVVGDKDLLVYLFDILRQQTPDKLMSVDIAEKGGDYVVYRLLMPGLRLSSQQCHDLFTPSVETIPYLLCRQIVREHGQLTNRRGCGIMAEPCAQGGVMFYLTLTKSSYHYGSI